MSGSFAPSYAEDSKKIYQDVEVYEEPMVSSLVVVMPALATKATTKAGKAHMRRSMKEWHPFMPDT